MLTRLHLTPPKITQLSLRVTPEQKKRLDDMAVSYKIEISSLVRYLIDRGIEFVEEHEGLV